MKRGKSIAIAIILISVAASCSGQSELERLVEMRRLSSELLVQFTTASDAANRAVMANTDDESAAFAEEAAQAVRAIQQGVDRLEPMVSGVGYGNEDRLLKEFKTRFAEYEGLDKTILSLAVEKSNLKAQRLSFGPVQKEADAFRDSLESVVRSASPNEAWRTRALAVTALSAVREIQALEAPHIAEPEDAPMTRIEQRMAASERATRRALDMLTEVVQPSGKPSLVAANDALARFIAVNTEVIALSRKNTNVRSLALSLGKKRMLTASCDESLRALQDTLAKRSLGGTR